MDNSRAHMPTRYIISCRLANVSSLRKIQEGLMLAFTR